MATSDFRTLLVILNFLDFKSSLNKINATLEYRIAHFARAQPPRVGARTFTFISFTCLSFALMLQKQIWGKNLINEIRCIRYKFEKQSLYLSMSLFVLFKCSFSLNTLRSTTRRICLQLVLHPSAWRCCLQIAFGVRPHGAMCWDLGSSSFKFCSDPKTNRPTTQQIE